MNPPVLIVGAGPTGLVLALWLARSGIAFRIIEKNSGPGLASRAMAVQARTLEFYRQLGIAEQVIQSGIEMKGIHLRDGPREVAGFPFGNIGSDISPYPFVLSFPQDDHERLLVGVLAAAGVHVEWNTEFVRLDPDALSVTTTVKKGEAEESVRFEYVCGCDGAHSAVRQQLKMNFPGGTYDQMFYVADVQAEGPTLNQEVNAFLGAKSLGLTFPVRSSGMYRLLGVVPEEFNGRNDVAFEDIRPYVKRQMDVDVRQVNWFSMYHVHHRVADHFRRGRIFIAGDAGHIHSPAGGQGMNTGIGDAVNLAWKLAGVIRGRTRESILDTYETERIAFARTLVATTDRIFQIAIGTKFTSRMIRRFLLPYVVPLALRFRRARRGQFRLVSQTRIHYRKSALSHGSGGKIGAGDRLPWLPGQDNFKPLASLDWQIHVFGTPTEALRTLASERGVPLHGFDWDEHAQFAGFARDGVYLVRPDGHIALAYQDQDLRVLEQYLSEWGLK